MTAEIIHGDCLDVMREMPDASMDAVVTSPPYADQRKAQYGGITEADYPAWTVEWMREVRRVVQPDSSVFINIREHIKNGEMSDYVHRTRLALRTDGWIECDELIWHKPDAPPVGHVGRPRRSWERVLWFARSGAPRCFPKAAGNQTRRIGLAAPKNRAATWVHGGQSDSLSSGTARVADIVSVAVRNTPNGIYHPAVFPPQLPAWLLALSTTAGDTVLDPFCGSGSTGVAATQGGRLFIGIERVAAYVEIARKRIADAQSQTAMAIA